MIILRGFLILLSLPALVIFSGGLPTTLISTLATTTPENESLNKMALTMISEKNIIFNIFNNELTEEPGGRGRIDPSSGGLGRMG